MSFLPQLDDFSALLKTFSPAQLLAARHEIDALLVPSALRKANQEISPLLRLPRDVLERIVDYAVSCSVDVVADDTSKEPGLLQTCHALRNAASRAFFSQNTFKRKRSVREQGLERWAKIRVGENRRHMRSVRLGSPVHCNNEEAEAESKKLEETCGFPPGTVWCLSEDDFENDHRWWVNSLGDTERYEEAKPDHKSNRFAADQCDTAPPSTRPAASWYCSSWAMGRDSTDYFSLRRGPPTPESRPSA